MTSSGAPRQLQLIGPPRWVDAAGLTHRLERRPAAVCAYLALEGPTPKYRLAELLWPDSGHTGARANMRQLLHRLRRAGAALVVGEDHLSLAEGLGIDVADCSSLDLPRVFALGDAAALLQGCEYDDAPDFADWLQATRDSLHRLYLRAAEAQVEALESGGHLAAALALAQDRCDQDPLAEAWHRRVMRLHHRLGDRAAALAAYRRCVDLLADELGTAPMAETSALARQIEQGADLPGPVALPSAPGAVPLALLRPPELVGRAQAWQAMEDAWQRGQLIVVTGPAGTGKTRLIEQFAAHKGRSLRIEGRPGDASVPFASLARNQRRLLAARPDLAPGQPGRVPRWAWQEAARLTPELSGHATAPSATVPGGPVDKLRFFDGLMTVYAEACRGLAALVVDDIHFYDEASLEQATYAMARAAPLGEGMPHHLVAFREDEVSAPLHQALQAQVARGIAAWIRLQPLPAHEVLQLLGSLGLPLPPGLAAALARYTGGNPLFVLETVRHLHQTGQLDAGWNGRLPLAGRVREQVERRLAALSEPARLLARAAAVLRSDYHYEQLCELLGSSPATLAPAWQELADAQWMAGERFSHDLLFEAVQASLPEALGRWLHRAAAAMLEHHQADPARIADHWQQAGEAARAATWRARAAEQAQTAGLVSGAPTPPRSPAPPQTPDPAG